MYVGIRTKCLGSLRWLRLLLPPIRAADVGKTWHVALGGIARLSHFLVSVYLMVVSLTWFGDRNWAFCSCGWRAVVSILVRINCRRRWASAGRWFRRGDFAIDCSELGWGEELRHRRGQKHQAKPPCQKTLKKLNFSATVGWRHCSPKQFEANLLDRAG